MNRERPPQQPQNPRDERLVNETSSDDSDKASQDSVENATQDTSAHDDLVDTTKDQLHVLARTIDSETFDTARKKLLKASNDQLRHPNVDISNAYLLLTALLFFTIDRQHVGKQHGENQATISQLQTEKLQLEIDTLRSEIVKHRQESVLPANTDSIAIPEFSSADVQLYESLLKRAALTIVNKGLPKDKHLMQLPEAYIDLSLDKSGDLILLISEDAKNDLRSSAFDLIDPRFGYQLVQQGTELAYRGVIDKDDSFARKRFQVVLLTLRNASNLSN